MAPWGRGGDGTRCTSVNTQDRDSEARTNFALRLGGRIILETKIHAPITLLPEHTHPAKLLTYLRLSFQTPVCEQEELPLDQLPPMTYSIILQACVDSYRHRNLSAHGKARCTL